MEILGIIIILIIFIISIYKIIREYKKCKTLNDKVLAWIFISILSFPTIIFYIDYFNIPSMLGWTSTMDSNTWLESIIGYVVTIIGAVIGAFVTICSVKMTIEDQEKVRSEENKKKALPLLKIDLVENSKDINKSIQFDYAFDKESKKNKRKNSVELKIRIRNVGMRELYDLHVGEFTSRYFSAENEYNYMYPIIYKDDNECIDLVFYEMKEYEDEEVYTPIISPFIFNCYFRDCYDNWYYQKFEFSIFHQIIKEIEKNRTTLNISIPNIRLISAPMEILEENLPWNN